MSAVINGPHAGAQHRLQRTYCSQCGASFGPGTGGYSHCADHRTRQGLDANALAIRREVKVELTVEELAAAFAALDSTNQAAFFNHVGKAAQTWEAPGFDTQAYSIVRSVFLGYAGTQILRSLSEHFAATERVSA